MQRRTVVWLLVVGVLILNLGVGSPVRGATPTAAEQHAARATVALSPFQAYAKEGLPQLDTALNQLLSGWKANREQARAGATAQGLKIELERVHVTILMLDEAAAEDALVALPGLGGEVTAHYKWAIDAWIPIARLEDLAKLPRVSLIHRLIPPMPLEDPPPPPQNLPGVGSYVTQGVAASNADEWQLAGYLGQGTNIAVIDQFQNYSGAQGAGELPATVYCYPTCGSLDLSSPHGTACAEIVYDMAPGATITLASHSGATDLAQKIVDLAANGRQVISVSQAVVDSTAPGDGTGIVQPAIAEARDTYGSFVVFAAGNHAQYHWDGNFNDTNADGWHEFSGGDNVNDLNYPLQLSAGTTVTAYLRWNAWPTTNQDFDLYLFWWSGSSWLWVARSNNRQTGTQPPWEFLSYTVPTTGYYGLAVLKYAASTNPVIDLMAWSRQPLQYQVTNRSLTEPATGLKSFSVAAVDVSTYNLESYSSHGPAHGTGGTLSAGVAQPRIAGYANVDTWSYGAGGFNGTSSAAPHVAGAAALVRGAYPSYTPAQVATFLEGRAIDLGTAGYDYLYGAGRLYLGSPPAQTLTVAKAGTGTGRVTSLPAGINCGSTCSADFDYNSDVTLSASAGVGSSFAGWSGEGCSGTGTCLVTMSEARDVTATFTLNTYSLSVSKAGTGTGTVTSSPAGITCGSTCASSFDYNTVVTLSASASTGSTFTSWSGEGCSGTGTCQVTMSQARAVTATFTLNTYALSVSKSGTGSGTVTSSPAGISCGATCSTSFDYNTVVTLSAIAGSNSSFTGWSGEGCSGTGTCQVTMDQARSVTATFTLVGCAQFIQQGSKLDGTGGASVALSADGNTAIVGWPNFGSYGAARVFTRSGGVWTQQGSNLLGSGAEGSPQQGISVALSADGNSAIVGGPGDDSWMGAAWVFTRSGGVWTQQGSKLVGTGAVGNAIQGYSVALSADGATAIVGGPADDSHAGAAWVFTLSGGVWTQQGDKLVGAGAVGIPSKGNSVALSADGNTAIVGGYQDNSEIGAAWVFTRSGEVWTQQGSKLVGAGAVGNAIQGYSIALSADGNTAIIGGSGDNGGAGAAWVFTRSGAVWTQQGDKLVGYGAVGNAEQGFSVALSADGNIAIVGGRSDNSLIGAAWVFTRSEGVWAQQGSKLIGTGALGTAAQGSSVALSADGTTAMVGGPNDQSSGAAWVFAHPPQSLTVSKAGTGAGTVTSSPGGISCGSTCSASLGCNTTVTLSASADAGSTFTGWSGEGCSGTGTCQVTMTQARSVTATFTLNTYLLTVNKTGTGGGTVTSSPAGINCGSTCSTSFDYNTIVTLSASADAGSTFTGWSGEGCSGTGTCQVTMSQARTVTATFELVGVPTRFFSITPCRVLDTRSTAPPILAAGSRRVFAVAGKCGVPTGAKVIVSNLTVVGAGAQGELKVIGGHLTATTTSSISFGLSRARANNAIVQLATDGSGTISVINNSAGTVHFILDVNGYFQ